MRVLRHRGRLPIFLGAVCSLFIVVAPLSGQTASDGWRGIEPGVVVEAVEKNYDADKAGLQQGDVLLQWKRDKHGGELGSPLTLDLINIEQRPRGVVTLTGMRNGTPQTWSLASRYWGITVRPNLPEGFLARYREELSILDHDKAMEAAERWRKAAASVPVAQSPLLRAWLLIRAANFFDQTGQKEASKAAFLEAIKVASVVPGNSALLLFQRADICVGRSDLESAADYYQQALAESLKAGTENQTADILTNFGFLEVTRSNLATAERYFREAVRIRKEAEPDGFDVARSLLNLGLILSLRGDLAGAEAQERQGLAISRKFAPHSGAVLVALNNLGEIASRRGDLDRAEEYYLEALKMKEKSPDAPEVAAMLENLGEVADQRGNLNQAEHYLQQALTIEQKAASDTAPEHAVAGNVSVATTLTKLGKVALDRGEFDKAEDLLTKALAMDEEISPQGISSAEVLGNLGELARGRRNLAASESFYRRALAIRQHLLPGTAQLAETLADLAWVVWQNGQADASADLYRQALEALESQTARLSGAEDTRWEFRSRYEKYYKEYIALLMVQKEPEMAFHVSERSRARSLAEMLASRYVDVRKGVEQALLDDDHRLKDLLQGKINTRVRLLSGSHSEKQIQDIENEITHLLQQRKEVEARIRAASPAYAALTQPKPLSASDVQKLLDPNSLLLEYSLGEERSYVFAMTPDSLSVHELPKAAEIENKAKHLYQLLTDRNVVLKGEATEVRQRRIAQSAAEYPHAAAMLSSILLGPLAAEVGNKRLVIVGDGALQYVPFAALPVPQKPYVPLIVEHEIVELPSASVLETLRAERKSMQQPSKQVAVLADPVFDAQDIRVKHALGEKKPDGVTRDAASDETSVELDSARQLTRSLADAELSRDGAVHLPRLAFTRREADLIAALAPAGTAREAVDFDANRDLAVEGELAKYRIVHFATHALVDNRHPELSGLVLSLVDEKGKPQNGFLDLQDIYNLDLAADLVVLSACDTALGKQVEGEGMVGLTRGFMYAGASRVVATLWSVDDVATAELMKRFYGAMEKQGMRPAAALRQAQIGMWKQKDWGPPYYWAAFQLQGEWR